MTSRKKSNQLKGLSIMDLLSIDNDTVNDMTRIELSRVVSRMSSVANKRLKRLEAAGYKRGSDNSKSPNIISGTKKFGSKGKSLNQLRNEFSRARDFLEGKTSTVTGMRKVRNEFYTRLSDVTGDDISTIEKVFNVSDYSDDDDLTPAQRFWRIVNNNNLEKAGYSSSQIQGIAYKVMQDNENISVIEAINRLNEMATESYEDVSRIAAEYERQNYITL